MSARFEGTVRSLSLFGAFSRCASLESVDLSNLDTSSTKDMSMMFQACKALDRLDLSSFDTSSAQDMSQMFQGCTSLRYLDLSHFETSDVIRMMEMFAACESLESLDLSSFDTLNVKDLSRMFQGCDSLQSLDLSSFDTSNASWRQGMLSFSCCGDFQITLGEAFSFENSVQNRVFNMPEIKTGDYSDRKVTGKWMEVGTGVVYDSNEVPSNHQATYRPEVLWQLVGSVEISGGSL